jgi:hypothetical protein
MRTILPLFAGVLALAVAPASAQSVISAKSGLISYIQGQVFLGDQTLEITSATTKFPEMKENEVLRTEDGLAEVLLPPGFTLRMGENSSIRMITNRLIDTRVELLSGSAIIDALEAPKDVAVTLVCKGGTISIAKSGHYRFDFDPSRLRVFAGMANVEINGQNTEVTGGKMLNLEGQSASIEKFDKNETDALENWSHRRAELTAMANVSAARRGGCRNSLYNGGSNGCWSWNPYFGLYTYIPLNGRYCDWTGYCYYSPNAAYRLFYRPPAPTYNPGYGGGGYYPSMGATSSGYSGAMASAPAMSSSPSVAASSGTSAASSAGASSVGHGSAGGGARGH